MSVVSFTHSIKTFNALINQIAYASRQKMLEANMRSDIIPMLCNGFVLDKFNDMVEFAKTFMFDPKKNDRIETRVRGVVFSLKDLIVQDGIRTDIDTTNQYLLDSALKTIDKYYPHHSYMLTIHNNTIHPHIHCYIATINHNDDRDYFTNRCRETNHSLEFIQSLNRHFNNEIAQYDDHHQEKPNNLVNALSLADYKEFYQALDENKPLIVSDFGKDTYNYLNANILRYFIEFEMEVQEEKQEKIKQDENSKKEKPKKTNKKLGRFYFEEFKNLMPYLFNGKKIRLTRAKRKKIVAHKKKLKMSKDERFVLKETTEFIVTIDHQKYRLKNSLKKQLVKKKRLSHVMAAIKGNKKKQVLKDQKKRLLLEKAPMKQETPIETPAAPLKQPPTNPVISATQAPTTPIETPKPTPTPDGGFTKRL